MEALKLIGLVLIVLLGFGILAGIIAAVSAIGFVLGWVVLGLLLISFIICSIYDAIKKR